jgi:hypothetical protein
MSTSTGANYAELYYGTCEIELSKRYLKNLALHYQQCIDDGIGL